jgi:Cellulose binding domain
VDEKRPPGRSRGVVEYVAELQQFDTAAPWALAPAGPEPAGSTGPEPAGRPAGSGRPEPADRPAPHTTSDPHADAEPSPPALPNPNPRGVTRMTYGARDVVPPEVYQLPAGPADLPPAGIGERRRLLHGHAPARDGAPPGRGTAAGSAAVPRPGGPGPAERVGPVEPVGPAGRQSPADRVAAGSGRDPDRRHDAAPQRAEATMSGPRVLAFAGRGAGPPAVHRTGRRRLQLVMAFGVVLVALGAGAIGYATLRRSHTTPVALAPGPPGVVPPSTDGVTPGLADADPVGSAPASPSAATPARPPAAGGTDPAAGAPTRTAPAAVPGPDGTATSPGGTDAPGGSATSAPERPSPVASDGDGPPAAAPAPPGSAPPGSAPPGSAPPGSAPPGSAPPLSAGLGYTAHHADDGILGYVGTITIVNAGDSDVTDWQVTLRVPGGNRVSADGPVSVDQGGEWVTFLPAGADGAVPAAGSLRFSFRVRGVLADLPSNCVVNDVSCV